MATWNSRGLRGSDLEEVINHTNDRYREAGLALVQKIPTPITPVEFDPGSSRITLAYFEKQSTVDYIGAVQGIPVCFDAKECAVSTFPLANVHEHQIRFMKEYEKQGGISFLLLWFKEEDRYHYLRLSVLEEFLERERAGGRKSFTLEELDPAWDIPTAEAGLLVRYLDLLAKDAAERD